MTIEDLDKIDRVYRNPNSGHAVLVITDHLPWDVDEGRHLELLQAKVYRQLDVIESGEIAEKVPFVRGHPFAIAIYSLFALSQDGRNLVCCQVAGLRREACCCWWRRDDLGLKSPRCEDWADEPGRDPH